MMKQMKKILFSLLLTILLPSMVSAGGLTCDSDNQVYNLTQNPNKMVFNFGSSSYTMNFYDTQGVAKTFCLDPGGLFRHGAGGYVCGRYIDPTGETTGVHSYEHAFDVAVTYAYYHYNDVLSATDLNSRAVGELVFRWLMFNYQVGTRKTNLLGGAYNQYFTMQANGTIPTMWYGVTDSNQRSIINQANEIYETSKVFANQVLPTMGNKTYADIKSELPQDDFQYDVAIADDASMGGRTMYTITFTAPSGAEVWWDDFTFDVTGSARVESVEHASGSNVFVVRVQHSGTFTIAANVKYYMSGSARTNMKILRNKVAPNSMQEMLVVTNEPGSAHTVIKGGQKVPVTPVCEYPGGDTSKVGIICEVDENGNKIPSTCREDFEHCPPTTPPTTGRTCESDNGTYYGVSGNVVTALVFYEECCESGLLTDEEYDLYCPCGEPDISFIGNCSEFNTANEVTNYVKDVKEGADLKTCLFNKASTDAAGNTVRMTDQTTIVNNPYCKVGCIEEYEFTLPNAQYTTSGGYFSLSSAISGKRTCYVNASDEGKFNGIDHEKFITDLFNASKEVAKAQATYNKLKKATESIDKDTRGCAHNVIYFNKEYSYTDFTVTRNGDNISVSPKSEKVGKDTWTDGKESGTEEDTSNCWQEDGKTKCATKCANNGSNGSESGLKGKILGGNSLETYAAAVTAAEAKVQAIIKQYDDCTHGWENNFVFDPVTEFEYDEPYQDMSGFNNKFEKTGENSSASTNYCSGDVGDDYNCNGSDSSYNQTYVTCSGGSCSQTSTSVSQSIYMKREKSTTATYQPKNKFGVYTPIGTIKLNEDTGLYTVLCKEENCLPVSLNATTGVFNYNFKFSNVGQYNDSNANGRLMGGSNNVFDAVNIEAGYVCQYVNNCPECDYTCVGEKCEIDEDPKCPDCPYVCQNCVFDGSDMTYYYRTVSINNLFPNNRSYGPNWSNSKGKYTKDLVENEGDEVYKEPEYSYTITANQMKNIREFNSSVGGYLNTQMPNGENALSCFDKSGYSNIYCTSTFLDTTGNQYFTQNKRNEQWILWQDSGYFTSSTKYSLRDGEGPSWK